MSVEEVFKVKPLRFPLPLVLGYLPIKVVNITTKLRKPELTQLIGFYKADGSVLTKYSFLPTEIRNNRGRLRKTDRANANGRTGCDQKTSDGTSYQGS